MNNKMKIISLIGIILLVTAFLSKGTMQGISVIGFAIITFSVFIYFFVSMLIGRDMAAKREMIA